MMRRIKWMFGVGAVVFVAMQLVPKSISNPKVTQDVAAPAPVETVLRGRCYNCHSNETRWPWYAHVAPVSWVIIRDVERGRQRVNFSTWDKYSDDPETLATKFRNIRRFSENGEMPLWYYLLAHPEARLSEADRLILEDWAAQSIKHASEEVH